MGFYTFMGIKHYQFRLFDFKMVYDMMSDGCRADKESRLYEAIGVFRLEKKE